LFVRGDVDREVCISVSNKETGFVLDPSQQHEFIGEPKAIHETGLDVSALVRGVAKHGGHESTETVGFARAVECSVAQRLKQHPQWELLSARWVDPSVHQATLLAGCQAERWNSQ
jgi:hypothetical protein